MWRYKAPEFENSAEPKVPIELSTRGVQMRRHLHRIFKSISRTVHQSTRNSGYPGERNYPRRFQGCAAVYRGQQNQGRRPLLQLQPRVLRLGLLGGLQLPTGGIPGKTTDPWS